MTSRARFVNNCDDLIHRFNLKILSIYGCKITMNSTKEECTPNNTVLNLTVDETLYSTIYTPVEWYIYMIVCPCFLIFGTTTNLSFLFVVIRVPYMRNITNFYLCNLAIADLLYLVITVVGQMTKYIRSPIRYVSDSAVLCILEPYIFITSFCGFYTHCSPGDFRKIHRSLPPIKILSCERLETDVEVDKFSLDFCSSYWFFLFLVHQRIGQYLCDLAWWQWLCLLPKFVQDM